MKKRSVVLGILGMIILSTVNIAEYYSPELIPGPMAGFFSGLALSFMVVFLFFMGRSLYLKWQKNAG